MSIHVTTHVPARQEKSSMRRFDSEAEALEAAQGFIMAAANIPERYDGTHPQISWTGQFVDLSQFVERAQSYDRLVVVTAGEDSENPGSLTATEIKDIRRRLSPNIGGVAFNANIDPVTDKSLVEKQYRVTEQMKNRRSKVIATQTEPYWFTPVVLPRGTRQDSPFSSNRWHRPEVVRKNWQRRLAVLPAHIMLGQDLTLGVFDRPYDPRARTSSTDTYDRFRDIADPDGYEPRKQLQLGRVVAIGASIDFVQAA
ncbi:hypothetical protein KC992_02865 [Candidatus Saccharibacteria bacterium]|nr:hypothetical protein [Candidatus Saccharibacteria bacterium]